MPVNADKPQLWKPDIVLSVDFYNNWFMLFAPLAYRDTRIATTQQVESALAETANLTNITSALMRQHPEVLPILRMAAAPAIARDHLGNPILDRQLFLLSCDLPPDEVKAKYPSLWEYLQVGVREGICDRYLCKHRSPWYSPEKRPPSPFLCTYMNRQDTGRGKPFRFILNHSMATATNVYLMLYPKPALAKVLLNKPELLKKVWQALDRISDDALMGEGRVYGGGLHKLEPRELGNALAVNILEFLPKRSVPQL